MEQPVFELALDLPPPGSRHLTRQLHRQLRDAIVEGRLKPGLRLPSTRDFAGHFGISRNTAIAVYELLLSGGFLTARQGAGTFVSEAIQPLRSPRSRPPTDSRGHDPRLPARSARLEFGFRFQPWERVDYDLRLGTPDTSLFPFDVWRRLTTRVIRSMERAPAGYLDPAGPETLRQAIAGHVSFTRAVACGAGDVVATTGAQQAFDLIARTLVEPGRTVVATENPGYPPIRAAFEVAGAKVRPVAVDRDGMMVERIPAAAKIICVTPSHQFPTGVLMSLERRHALLEFAQANGAVIIEDDYDSEFRYGSRPLDALQTLDRNESVFYVGTFSKCLFPSLRIGFTVAPPWAHKAIVERKKLADWHGPDLLQKTLAEFMREGHLVRHVRRMRGVYGERRMALRKAIEEHCSSWLEPIASHAGLHQAACFKGDLRSEPLVSVARQAGIAVESLARYASGQSRPDGLAFGYGSCPTERIPQALERLGDLMSDVRRP